MTTLEKTVLGGWKVSRATIEAKQDLLLSLQHDLRDLVVSYYSKENTFLTYEEFCREYDLISVQRKLAIQQICICIKELKIEDIDVVSAVYL